MDTCLPEPVCKNVSATILPALQMVKLQWKVARERAETGARERDLWWLEGAIPYTHRRIQVLSIFTGNKTLQGS